MQMRATELAASRRPSASPRSSGGAALERREAGQVRSSATAGMKGARTSLFRGRVRVGVRVRARVKVRGKGRVRRRGPTRRLPPKGRRRGRGWRRPSRGHPSAQRCGRTACGMLHGRSMAGREARTLRTTAITTTTITTTVLLSPLLYCHLPGLSNHARGPSPSRPPPRPHALWKEPRREADHPSSCT